MNPENFYYVFAAFAFMVAAAWAIFREEDP